MIEPQVLQRIIKEVADEFVADLDAAIKQTMEEGYLLWQTATPAQRLHGYLSVTYPDDRLLVLTEGYYDLYKAGAMPPLRAETEWQKVTMPDPMTGQVGIPSDFRPFTWALWLLFPKFVFEQRQRDFRNLLKAELEKPLGV